MPDIKVYKTQDLVLQVKQNYNPAKLNLKKWVSFLDVLCGDREFQKEAIRDAVIFLASGEYRSIEDLVEENFRKNEELKKSKIKQRYFFHFLSPNSYAEFVEYFCDNRVFDKKFRSKLEDLLNGDQGVRYG